MREIKFKVWNRISKVMGYVHSIDFAEEEVKVRVDNPSITQETGLSFDFRYWNFDAIELMQFTGLYDKNGVEIYEGDLVKIPNDYELYGQFAGEAREIFYNEGGFRLKPKWNKNYKGNYLESGIDYEVIGNVHEERSKK